MELRSIRPEDDAALAAIVRECLEEYGLDLPGTAYFDPELDRLSGFYAAPGRDYFVAVTEEGRVAGGAGYGEYAGYPGRAELQKMYLAGWARGLGLGQTLVEKVARGAAGDGYRELYLETHHVLERAVRLYRSAGFLPTEGPETASVHHTMDLFFQMPLTGGTTQE